MPPYSVLFRSEDLCPVSRATRIIPAVMTIVPVHLNHEISSFRKNFARIAAKMYDIAVRGITKLKSAHDSAAR